MKVLVFHWGSLSDADIVAAMKASGYDVAEFSCKITDYEKDDELERLMLLILRDTEFSYVFSFNYIPVVAKVCHRVKIKYVSWIYDSPHLTLYSDTVLFPENYMFHFDKEMVEQLKKMGAQHVFHLLLAVDGKRLAAICSLEMLQGSQVSEETFFRHEISFLGTLYEDNNYDKINSFPAYLKGYFDGTLAVQSMASGQQIIKNALTEERMRQVLDAVKFSLKEVYPMSDDKQVFLDMFLLRKVAHLERTRMLRALSEVFEDVVIYTGSKTKKLPKVKNMGYADYFDKMPQVFCRSKINLNLSLRTITSGIPLRVFDIMGAGGFVLTNAQPELREIFNENEDYVAFSNLDEMMEKVEYYLSHEKERQEICLNGCRKVRTEHTYEKRLRWIEDIME